MQAEPILEAHDLNPDPFLQFDLWWTEYKNTKPIEASAMFLATSNTKSEPSGRVVLLKSASSRGFLFFTNYDSQKGSELLSNPRCSLTFFWDSLNRQVRVVGRVEKASNEESDEYYKSRPYESQIGAWASKQSSVLTSRKELDETFKKVREKYPPGSVPRPPNWGGFRVIPVSFEFWQGRNHRLHDRFRYRLNSGRWLVERLAP